MWSQEPDRSAEAAGRVLSELRKLGRYERRLLCSATERFAVFMIERIMETIYSCAICKTKPIFQRAQPSETAMERMAQRFSPLNSSRTTR